MVPVAARRGEPLAGARRRITLMPAPAAPAASANAQRRRQPRRRRHQPSPPAPTPTHNDAVGRFQQHREVGLQQRPQGLGARDEHRAVGRERAEVVEGHADAEALGEPLRRLAIGEPASTHGREALMDHGRHDHAELGALDEHPQDVAGVALHAGRAEQIAEEGLNTMKDWMEKIGVTLSIGELGATEDMIEGIADGTIILDGGYKTLTKDEVIQVLKESM